VFAGLVFKEKCMTLPTQARLLFLPRGFWSSFMWIYLVLLLMQALVGRNIAWLLLMTIEDIHGFISLNTRVRAQKTIINLAKEVERQYGQNILARRSDSGSEFKNYTLNDFLSEEGIHHQYSAAYTPQQNGVAERKNRTLMDMARSMLAEFKSPYHFWAKDISTACHSSNWLYLRKCLNKTPYEILTGSKPNIKYF
jgi:hypothetical protein